MWKHEEAEWKAVEWHIQEMEDYLREITDATRVWLEVKQDSEIELKDNTQRPKMTQEKTKTSHK